MRVKRGRGVQHIASPTRAGTGARLTMAPGVGPVTASAFAATSDDITRFRTAHELEA
jgi:transposase